MIKINSWNCQKLKWEVIILVLGGASFIESFMLHRWKNASILISGVRVRKDFGEHNYLIIYFLINEIDLNKVCWPKKVDVVWSKVLETNMYQANLSDGVAR